MKKLCHNTCRDFNSLPCVYSCSFKVEFCVKRLATLTEYIWLLSIVCIQVSFKITFTQASLFTISALMEFPSNMFSCMLLWVTFSIRNYFHNNHISISQFHLEYFLKSQHLYGFLFNVLCHKRMFFKWFLIYLLSLL